MSLTIDLPDAVLRRLTAEADRRGVRVDEVIAYLAAQLPAAALLPPTAMTRVTNRAPAFSKKTTGLW